MDAVAEFLAITSGHGYGSGSGHGYGSGSGHGSGHGYRSGYGDGYRSGYGDGYGDGSGYGYGSGYGDGSGYGSGSGYGDGSGYGIKAINGAAVHVIDGIPTIISSVKGNIARGSVPQKYLALKKCYVAKVGDCFAHGDTIESALQDVMGKHLQNIPVEERLAEFDKAFPDDSEYPVSEFFTWHGTLTGSCRLGREQFMSDRGISMDGKMTVSQFVALTKDQYGGDVIRQIKPRSKQL